MAAKSNWIFACFQKDSARTESYTNGILEKEKLAEDWLQKYAPTIPSELAVQKSKQDLINAWLQQVKNSVGLVPFLIITGPSGCGKTTALRVLAKAQNIEVVEWITPLDIENYEYGFGSYMQSQSSKFQEFLASTGRYISVFGDGKYAKKLILVKDFPNVFLTQPNTLQSILRNYSTIGRNPVVFSIPEQMDGFNLMFPKSFIEELNIQQISFNKIPNKSVLKVLKNICYFNKNSSINDDILDKVIESCNGDIRNAVLQLSYENKCYKEVETAPRKLKRGRKDTKKKLQTSELNELKTLELIGKDIQIPIFQRVGRLLYPKKNSSTDNMSELKHDPEEIVEQTITQPRRFLNMVHENYLKIFRDMDAACRAIKYSSDSDTMISEFRERDLTLPMALSTITRGFMTCSATANRKWMPLTNQENASVRKRTQALKDIAINIDPKYILIPRDASMDILPIICPEYSVKKSSHRYVDSELCISDEEELSISDGNKRLKTNIYTDANYFSNSKSKINERGLTEEDEILGCYKIEEIQSDSESEVNCQVEWEDEDVEFLENLDI